jgi:Photosynthetic reaction centre cytochrome C subunit
MHRNKLFAVLGLSAFVILGVAAVHEPFQKERNLKVLPLDISDQKLDSIMKTYNVALGVKCDFCHVPVAGFKDSLDYASDKIHMKEDARKMMRMVIDINKNNFWYNKEIRPEFLNTVTCKTCHRGEAFPDED